MLTAITREVSPELANCELTFQRKVAIDVVLARRQHRAYVDALIDQGCDVVRLTAAPGFADAVFVEDTALVLPEIGILCRPGAASRRGEVESIGAALAGHRTIAAIEAPGTLDGGDLLCVGKRIFAGLSTRSNKPGIDQLRRLTADHGYTVHGVATNDCLHLKSAVTEVAPGVLLANPDWTDIDRFGDYEVITIDPREPHAANALRIGERVIYPTSFPHTADRLAAHGIDLVPVDVSELQKAEGAVTCCSLVFGTER